MSNLRGYSGACDVYKGQFVQKLSRPLFTAQNTEKDNNTTHTKEPLNLMY